MIAGNTKADGNLDIDKFQQAILQYRNTPDPTTHLSPANCLFGRTIRDLLPVLPGKYRHLTTWDKALTHRETTLAKRHHIDHQNWTAHTT